MAFSDNAFEDGNEDYWQSLSSILPNQPKSWKIEYKEESKKEENSKKVEEEIFHKEEELKIKEKEVQKLKKELQDLYLLKNK